MKISVSLADRDVEFMDQFAAAHGIDSRSAVVQRALERLRALDLEADYAAAWDEFEGSGDAAAWEEAVGDEIAGTDAAR